jgi:hypothetical protein
MTTRLAASVLVGRDPNYPPPLAPQTSGGHPFDNTHLTEMGGGFTLVLYDPGSVYHQTKEAAYAEANPV